MSNLNRYDDSVWKPNQQSLKHKSTYYHPMCKHPPALEWAKRDTDKAEQFAHYIINVLQLLEDTANDPET